MKWVELWSWHVAVGMSRHPYVGSHRTFSGSTDADSPATAVRVHGPQSATETVLVDIAHAENGVGVYWSPCSSEHVLTLKGIIDEIVEIATRESRVSPSACGGP